LRGAIASEAGLAEDTTRRRRTGKKADDGPTLRFEPVIADGPLQQPVVLGKRLERGLRPRPQMLDHLRRGEGAEPSRIFGRKLAG
jgi:hypothetical protein